MDQDKQTNNDSAQPSPIDPAQLEKIKSDIINNAKTIAKLGIKTVKNSQDTVSGDPTNYDWWEYEQSFDNDFWSISFWDYPNGLWQIQITKVTIQSNGSSLMVSFSVRTDQDKQFPGFQVYQESVDDSYRQMKIEEFILLDRVLQGIQASPHEKS
ncbi:MAG TPA: hypothetical protein VMQ58_01430 [Candidatus Saccharimonadales bacterium]|jgi:hypothetical protein|nr:hypothetical protein [Candidatus Saccharimonadales bacterium]